MDRLWNKDNRPHKEYCEAIEATLAQSNSDLFPHDFTARIEVLRNGKYALAFWTMDLGSCDTIKTEGDRLSAEHDQVHVDMAEKAFRRFLSKRMMGDVPDSGPLQGQEIFVFDSPVSILATVNEYRTQLAERGLRPIAIAEEARRHHA